MQHCRSTGCVWAEAPSCKRPRQQLPHCHTQMPHCHHTDAALLQYSVSMGCSTLLQTPTTAVAALPHPDARLSSPRLRIVVVQGVYGLYHPLANAHDSSSRIVTPRCRIAITQMPHCRSTGCVWAVAPSCKRPRQQLPHCHTQIPHCHHTDAALSEYRVCMGCSTPLQAPTTAVAALSQPDAASSSPRCRIVAVQCVYGL